MDRTYGTFNRLYPAAGLAPTIASRSRPVFCLLNYAGIFQ